MSSNPFGPRRNEVTIEPNRSGQLWPGGIDPQTNTPINLDAAEPLRVDSQSMQLGTRQPVPGEVTSDRDYLTGEEVIAHEKLKDDQGGGVVPVVGQMGFDFGDS